MLYFQMSCHINVHMVPPRLSAMTAHRTPPPQKKCPEHGLLTAGHNHGEPLRWVKHSGGMPLSGK